MDADTPEPRVRYRRGELEFERLAFFSDAIYAISLTLLVVGLEPSKLTDRSDAGDLWSVLGDLGNEILMFFISFFVIGSFWLAHHRFISRLAAADRALLVASLPYLAMIAFLPFPSGLLGEYADNPAAVGIYAFCIAVVATLEAVLFTVARNHQLLLVAPNDLVFRWGMVASLTPAAIFLLSIPLAFVSPTLAILSWLLNMPVGILVSRRMPAEVTEYYDR